MTKLEQAARALLAHWDTPAWKCLKPTGDLMADLREALEHTVKPEISDEAFNWIDANAPMFVREALDHSADTGNKVSDHIAGVGKVILTKEQVQQIEKALAKIPFEEPSPVTVEALAAIAFDALPLTQAARAQKQAEQEPVFSSHCPKCNHKVISTHTGEVWWCPKCQHEWPFRREVEQAALVPYFGECND